MSRHPSGQAREIKNTMIELLVKHWVYVVFLFTGLSALSLKFALRKQKLAVKPRSVDPNKNRKPGTWTPTSFKTPTPQPYKHWDFEKTRPLPYRAFRHKYNITMGIRSMEWDNWIELDNEWQKFHDSKVQRLEKRGTDVYGTKPEAKDAVLELLDEFYNFLPNRYPSLFEQTAHGMKNLKTGENFVFKNCSPDQFTEDPMVMAAKMVQDDLAIMMEGPLGQYFLKAGAIILPGFWRFKDKFGLPLEAIHTEGDVPKYKEKLMAGMNKFFTRLTCDKPVVRNNYFIQVDDQLGWSSAIGNEDSDEVGWNTAKPAESIDQVYYRSERQSLRRLPKTGAVVFTIRTYFVPITEMCQEPYIPYRLLCGIESWTPDVQQYRGYEKFKDVIMPYLAEKAKEQQLHGYIPEKEPSVYPF